MHNLFASTKSEDDHDRNDVSHEQGGAAHPIHHPRKLERHLLARRKPVEAHPEVEHAQPHVLEAHSGWPI